MQQYKLHEQRSQLSSAAIGSHSRHNSGLGAQQQSYANNRNGVISAAGLRELRQIIWASLKILKKNSSRKFQIDFFDWSTHTNLNNYGFIT